MVAINQMHLPEDVALAVRANVAVITTLPTQIGVVEERLQEKVAPNPDYALLTTVPGIGQTLATVILFEIGPIERFANAGNFASYARCVDSQHTSNGKKRRQRQERQPISVGGVHWGGQLRAALLCRSQALLRAQESQNQHGLSAQGTDAQAGPRVLPYAEGAQGVGDELPAVNDRGSLLGSFQCLWASVFVALMEATKILIGFNNFVLRG